MPRYVVERQFLVPVFEHIMIEADDLVSACMAARDESAHPWRDHSTVCYEDADPVTIVQVVELPEEMLPELRADDDIDHYTLNDIIYGSGFPLLAIPAEVTLDPDDNDSPGFV